MRALLLVLTVSLAGLLATSHYRIATNTTSSMPLGQYLAHLGAPVARGDLVLACLNTVGLRYERTYHPDDLAHGPCAQPMLKEAVAIAGDRVRLSAAGVAVNGQPPLPYSRPIDHFRTARGQRVDLPKLPYGTYVVPRGAAWLWTPTWYSFDSRYYGPVAPFAVLRPLHTWAGRAPTDDRAVVLRT